MDLVGAGLDRLSVLDVVEGGGTDLCEDPARFRFGELVLSRWFERDDSSPAFVSRKAFVNVDIGGCSDLVRQ